MFRRKTTQKESLRIWEHRYKAVGQLRPVRRKRFSITGIDAVGGLIELLASALFAIFFH